MSDESSNKLKRLFFESPMLTAKHESYFEAYAEELSCYVGKQITFVEVGVMNGGSLFMWRKFFGEQARVIGIDVNPGALELVIHGYEIYIGSQSDKNFWKNFFEEVGPVDIVLDDGGHTYKQQIITAKACIPHLRDGGKLIIEDVHTSYYPSFGYPSRYSFINWSKHQIDRINYRSKSIPGRLGVHSDSIYSLRFYESIVSFHINRTKCMPSAVIENGGKSILAQDFRYKDSLIEKIERIEMRILNSRVCEKVLSPRVIVAVFARLKRLLVMKENILLKSEFE